MKRTGIATVIILVIISASCSREDRFQSVYDLYQTHTVFNISVANNTRTKGDMDHVTTYNADKNHAYIKDEVDLGIVGVNDLANTTIKNDYVKAIDGVRRADIINSNLSIETVNLKAYYPYVNDVSYREDGAFVVSFSPDEIKMGPLASEPVKMNCSRGYESVDLNFHHITNHIGFKVCDVTADEQLRGLMNVKKIVLHGMPTEGLFISNGLEEHWAPQSKHNVALVVYEGYEHVLYGEENSRFVASNTLSDDKADCNRFYVVPEEIRDDKHYLEVFFDVDDFVYDGTSYRGAKNVSHRIPLVDVLPDNMMELGLQYTFVLGMNLGTIYRAIEFTADVEDWNDVFSGKVLDFDNE